MGRFKKSAGVQDRVVDSIVGSRLLVRLRLQQKQLGDL
jgi:hypothetical protein